MCRLYLTPHPTTPRTTTDDAHIDQLRATIRSFRPYGDGFFQRDSAYVSAINTISSSMKMGSGTNRSTSNSTATATNNCHDRKVDKNRNHTAAFRIVIQWPVLPEHKHALTTDQLNLYLGQTEVVPYYKLLPEQLDITKADSASIRQSRLQPLD